MNAQTILSMIFLAGLSLVVVCWLASIATPKWMAAILAVLGVILFLWRLDQAVHPEPDFYSPNPDLPADFR